LFNTGIGECIAAPDGPLQSSLSSKLDLLLSMIAAFQPIIVYRSSLCLSFTIIEVEALWPLPATSIIHAAFRFLFAMFNLFCEGSIMFGEVSAIFIVAIFRVLLFERVIFELKHFLLLSRSLTLNFYM
jgi:hypothetical protein